MESWIMLALASGMMFGIYNLIMKAYSAKAPANIIVMTISAGVLLCGLFYLITQKGPAGQVSLVIPIIGLILLSAVIWFIATMLQVSVWSDPKGSISIGAIILTVSLVLVTTIGGVLFFGEKISNLQIVGIILAIAGTVLLSM